MSSAKFLRTPFGIEHLWWVLSKGSQLTPFISDILLKFQTLVIALIADIEKAFLQDIINLNDRDYLRFLWLYNVFAEVPKIVRNRFARVSCDMTSSLYLINEYYTKTMEL